MRVLVIDDEANLRKSVRQILELDDHSCDTSENPLVAMKLLEESRYDVILLDLKMPGMDGLAFLDWMRREGPDIPVVMASAFGEVPDAVEAMKRGAYDYLVKPFEADELTVKLTRAAEDGALTRQARLVGRDTAAGGVHDGAGPAMRRVYDLALRAAPSDATCLITGESGTGKEVLARFIHRESKRADGPFVPINVGALPSALLESELFGHEKGAFTGADRRKEGLFETAAGGTLFLDEIGEMPIELQVKLLRALQDRQVQRLGATRLMPVDIRVLAATNRDLERAIAEGAFRQDLYYRLNVIHVELPPLRDRPEDVAMLAGHFLRKIAERHGEDPVEITAEAIRALQGYRFPGNVRELENLVERAYVLRTANVLHPRDFGLASPSAHATSPDSGPRTMREIEREAIRHALLRNNSNRTHTAEELGISRRTLINKIRELQLEGDTDDEKALQ